GHGVVEADDAVLLDLQGFGFGAHGTLVAGRQADARRAVACQPCGDSAKMPAVMEAAHYPGSPAAAPTWRLPAATLALLAGLLAGCGHEPARSSRPQATAATPQAWPKNEPADPAAANAVLMRAISLVGTPYRYGGNTPEGGFDCSGLVNYVYRDMLDLKLPRTSRDLAAWQGPRISPQRLTTADLVFFGSRGHVS